MRASALAVIGTPGRDLVERKVEAQHVDMPFADKSAQAVLSLLCDQRCQISLGQAAHCCNPGDLRLCVCGRAIRVKTRGRGGDSIGRRGCSARHIRPCPVDQFLRQPAEVGTAGRRGITGAGCGGRARVEMAVSGQVLPDQVRADHLAVLGDLAAVGLMGKGDLCDAGY